MTETSLHAAELLLLLVLLGVTLWRRTQEPETRHNLGMEYARLALKAAAHLPSHRAEGEVKAFRLIDTSADGRRDFTDAQARTFLEAARLETQS